MRRATIVCAMCGFACVLFGQVPAESKLVFEVASVKRAAPISDFQRIEAPSVNGGVGTSNPGRITYRLMPLHPLISTAFGVRVDQIKGPGWMDTERYDIIANIPPATSRAQFNVMLGNLLRERFNLRFHMDLQERSVYAQQVAKKGPKLKESVTVDSSDPGAGIGRPDDKGYPILPSNYRGIVGRASKGSLLLTGQQATLAELVRWLEGPAGSPIVDET